VYAIKTIKEIADEVGVSKQAVFKRINKEPLKSTLASLDGGIITSSGNKKIYLSDSAEDIIKRAFMEASPIHIPYSSISPEADFVKVDSINKKDTSELDTGQLKGAVDLLKHQLEIKDRQLSEKDDQLRSKDDQIRFKDEQIKELQQSVKTLSEGLNYIHKLVVKKFYKLLRQPFKTSTVNMRDKKPVYEPLILESQVTDEIEEHKEVEKHKKYEALEAYKVSEDFRSIKEPEVLKEVEEIVQPDEYEVYEKLEEKRAAQRPEDFYKPEKYYQPEFLNEPAISPIDRTATVATSPVEDSFDFDFSFLRR